jgi:hypothetical protein
LIVCTRAQSPAAILSPKKIGEEELGRREEIGATLTAGLVLALY